MSGGTHHPIPEFRDADHFWGPGLSQVVNGSHEIIRPKPRRWVHFTSSTLNKIRNIEKRQRGKEKKCIFFFNEREESQRASGMVGCSNPNLHLRGAWATSNYALSLCVLKRKRKIQKRGKDATTDTRKWTRCVQVMALYIGWVPACIQRRFAACTNAVDLVRTHFFFPSLSPIAFPSDCNWCTRTAYTAVSFILFSFSITAAPQITTFFFPSPLIAVSNWGRELISSRFFFSSSPFLYIYLLLRGMLFFFLFQHPPLFPPESARFSLGTCSVSNHEIFFFVRKRARKVRENEPPSPQFSLRRKGTR